MRSILRSLTLLSAVALVGACSGGGEGPVGPPPVTTPSVTSVSALVPGQTATLTGVRLGSVTAATVDGVAVTGLSASESSISFTVPALRTCEMDGRTVTVSVTGASGSASTTGALTVTGTPAVTALRVGQRLVLDGAVGCLQLPKDATARFALTWVNLSRTMGVDSLFRLTTYGGATASATRLSADRLTEAQPPTVGGVEGSPDATLRLMRQWRQTASRSVTLTPSAATRSAAWSGTDPATAVAGDTVHIIDWMGNGSGNTGGLVPMVVAAVHGYVVVLVDPRVPNAAQIAGDTARWTAASATITATLEPALTSVFGTDTQVLLPGQNGRMFVVVTALPAGMAAALYGPNNLPTTMESRSLYANTVALTPTSAVGAPGLIATLVAHENTHVIDFNLYATASRNSGSDRSSWFVEALAAATEETAARIAKHAPVGATVSGPATSDPIPEWQRLNNGWLQIQPNITLLSTSLSQGAGAYTQGSQLVLYARERLQQADYRTPTTRAQTLWGRLYARYGTSSYDNVARTVDDVAAVLNLTGDQLLAQYANAVTLDDLVSADVAAAESVPQFATWINGGDAATFGRADLALPRGASRAGLELLGAGSYNVRYIEANGGAGLALSVTPVATAHYELRLTRLR